MTKDDAYRGVLLVGGPCDGERHVVRRGQTVLGFAEKPTITVLATPQDPMGKIEIRTCRYEQSNDSQIFEFKGWDSD